MKKVIILLALLALSLSALGGCGGGGAGSANVPAGENPGTASVVQLLPTHFIAQTNSSITLHAKVLDGNGIPLNNIPVTFTNLSEPFGIIKTALKSLGIIKPIGVLSATVANTNSAGIATVVISSTTSGFATVQAEVNTGVGIVRDKKTVFFSLFDLAFPTPPSPPPPTLSLDIFDSQNSTPNEFDDTHLFQSAPVPQPDNQVTVRATVRDGSGNLVSNMSVTFGADSTEATFPLGNTKTTDLNGQASVLMKVDPSIPRDLTTVLNVTATADNGAFNLTTLFLGPVTIAPSPTSSLSALPTVVNTGATSTITAVVKLNTGGPAPDGTSVNFTTTCGSVDPFGQTTGGVATATFTAPTTPGTCTVTGKVGGVTIGTAAITVTTTLTVQPGTQTVNGIAGATGANAPKFTIFGGNPGTTGYIIASSNLSFLPSPATVTSSGGSFTVDVPANTPTTTVTYTIRDEAGTTITATLNIAGAALAVYPATQTVDGVNGATGVNAPKFTIFGGAPGYTITSDNTLFPPSATSVASSGGDFTVNVAQGSQPVTVTYTIRDSVGNTEQATLIITGLATLSLTPTTFDIGTDSAGTVIVEYFVSGGKAPYKVYFTLPITPPNLIDPTSPTQDGATVGTAGTNQTTFRVTYRWDAGITAKFQVIVVDTLGAFATSDVNMSGTAPEAPALAVLPPSQTVNGAAPADIATFTVVGGTPGYTISSSNLLFPPSTTSIGSSGGTFTVTVPAGSPATTVTYTIRDQAGDTVTATLNITGIALTVTPASQTVAPVCPALGGSASYTIVGGSPTYSVFTNRPDITSFTFPSAGDSTTVAASGGTFTIAHDSAVTADTTVTITVLDTLGATKTVDFKIDCP